MTDTSEQLTITYPGRHETDSVVIEVERVLINVGLTALGCRQWWAAGNGGLKGRRPIDVLRESPEHVMQVAQLLDAEGIA